MSYIGKTPTAVPLESSDLADGIVSTDKLAANAVTTAKITDGTIAEADIANDAVTADKIANAVNSAIAANTAKTTNATHSGEVTGSGALTIADNVVDEANLKVSNSPSNGYVLTAQSGNTGGLTWQESAGGGKLLQVFNKVIDEASGTTTIPFDNTTPTTSEGTLIFEQAITCAATSSKVRITGVVNCGALGQDSSNGFGIAVFRDNTCVGMYAFQDWTAFTDGSYAIPVHIVDAPSSTSALTYKLRVGNLYDSNHNTTTWKVGGSATGRGAKFNSRLGLNTIELNELGA